MHAKSIRNDFPLSKQMKYEYEKEIGFLQDKFNLGVKLLSTSDELME